MILFGSCDLEFVRRLSFFSVYLIIIIIIVSFWLIVVILGV